MIRVVIADDSHFICRLLTSYLESDPALKVIKTVHNGKEAMMAAKNLKPDVITLDLNMPEVNGIQALKYIMAECPTAVVLISGVARQAADMTGQGLAMGAVDFILKYSPKAMLPPEVLRREIIAKVKAASKIKVIRSIPSINVRFSGRFPQRAAKIERVISPPVGQRFQRVAIIGASTGGPLAIKELLLSMNPSFTFTIVIVQHIPEGFSGILAQQFNRLVPFSVKEAVSGDKLQPGTVLIAPGNKHLLFDQDGSIILSGTNEVNGHRPSIDVTMQSAAQIFGDSSAGVILSGMGNDGAEGLIAIKNNCGITYAQSSETCVVDSMPISAIRMDSVRKVGSPAEIGRWLTSGSVAGITLLPRTALEAANV